MQYVLLFLEGLIAFVSPCFLPLLPIYISYLAGSDPQGGRGPLLRNTFGFLLGFTLVFIALGAFAGTIGRVLFDHSRVVSIVSGAIVVAFGLNYLGFFKLSLPFGRQGKQQKALPNTFPNALLFGFAFSLSWTACITPFLASALLRAATQGGTAEGMFMLFVFSLGIGVPFLASALLMDQLQGAFSFIRKNYARIKAFSGGFLLIMGILMMTGIFGRFAALFG